MKAPNEYHCTLSNFRRLIASNWTEQKKRGFFLLSRSDWSNSRTILVTKSLLSSQVPALVSAKPIVQLNHSKEFSFCCGTNNNNNKKTIGIHRRRVVVFNGWLIVLSHERATFLPVNKKIINISGLKNECKITGFFATY